MRWVLHRSLQIPDTYRSVQQEYLYLPLQDQAVVAWE
jgi:hypothetical protein